MTIVRVGTTQIYAAGWEKAFGGKGKKKSAVATVSKRKSKRKVKK
jgi:hypothetical protein